MGTPVIVGAVRTAIGRSFKGTLVNTPPETLITAVLPEVVRRSGVDPAAIDDIIFAESHYGAAISRGMRPLRPASSKSPVNRSTGIARAASPRSATRRRRSVPAWSGC